MRQVYGIDFKDIGFFEQLYRTDKVVRFTDVRNEVILLNIFKLHSQKNEVKCQRYDLDLPRLKALQILLLLVF